MGEKGAQVSDLERGWIGHEGGEAGSGVRAHQEGDKVAENVGGVGRK